MRISSISLALLALLAPVACDPGDEPILLPRAKHMRYIYQQEQRILCHPRTPVGKLEPITVEVGPLSTFAELVSV